MAHASRRPYLAVARCGCCGCYAVALLVPLLGGGSRLFCAGCGSDGRPDGGMPASDPPIYDPTNRRPTRRPDRPPRPIGRPRKP